MTINTWQTTLLARCKYCHHFTDRGKNRYRYQCDKYNVPISKAHACKKTKAIRKQAAELSTQELTTAFAALISGPPSTQSVDYMDTTIQQNTDTII